METLEERQMFFVGPIDAIFTNGSTLSETRAMSVGDVSIDSQSGVVTINGRDATRDTAIVTIDGKGTPTTADDMLNVSLSNIGRPIVKQFPLVSQGGVSGVTSIVFNGFGQADRFDNQANFRSTAFGGTGDDTLLGGANVDEFFGGEGNDYLDGRLGGDTLWGDGGDDKLFGDAGDDTLHGGANNDRLFGGAGNDSLFGEDGDDDIEGGTGVNPTLFGGAGIDTWYGFNYSRAVLAQTHTDVNVAEGDFTYKFDTSLGRLDLSLLDPAVRSLVRINDLDSVLSRGEMLDIYKLVRQDGVVSSNELTDLKSLESDLVLMSGDVRNLAGKIAFGDAANAQFKNGTLGNLQAGDSADKLDKLVQKWFLGLDHPQNNVATYDFVQGQLFVNGPNYADVDQGGLGDCYFLASLAEVAHKSPLMITNMFTDNGDGTFAVRFFHDGTAEYVTVDRYLPIGANGRSPFAGFGGTKDNAGNELWVALAEKAYAQINESGWTKHNGINSYEGIVGGFAYDALPQITGKPVAKHTFTETNAFTQLVNDYQSGKSLVFTTPPSGSDSNITPLHEYAVVGYDAASQRFLCFNPHGFGSPNALVWQDFSQLKHNFISWILQ